MEFVSSRLCCANDIPCMVIDSRDKTPEYFNTCDTMRLFAGRGEFTVDADRSKVGGVLEKMIEAKAVSEYEKGNIGTFRGYLLLWSSLLNGLPTSPMELPEGVSPATAVKHLMKWRDEETERAWMAATGCTPLHVACALGLTDAAREMLNDPAMANYLHQSMRKINAKDTNAKDKSMGVVTIAGTCKQLATPLSAAMVSGRPDMVKLLIEAGAKPTRGELSIGCCMGSVQTMRALLECAPEHFDVNGKVPAEILPMMGCTAMHIVCLFGDGAMQLAKAELLLKHGATPSLHKRNLFGLTPLSCLAANPDAHPACVKLLASAGAKLDAKDKPRKLACIMRGTMAGMAVTKHYSNLETILDFFGYGRFPVHHAAHTGNVSMLRALHEQGAVVEKLDGKSRSVHDLIVRARPDSHAPELLQDVLAPNQKLRAAANAVRAANRLQSKRSGLAAWAMSARPPAKVMPHPFRPGGQ